MATATQPHAPHTPDAPHAPPADPPTDAVVQVRATAANENEEWVTICRAGDLTPGRGVAVVLPGGEQAAVFRTRSGAVHAIGNRDPFTGAYVLSRGLVGSVDGSPFVASPLLKQRFALTDGRCLDDPEVTVPAHVCRTLRS